MAERAMRRPDLAVNCFLKTVPEGQRRAYDQLLAFAVDPFQKRLTQRRLACRGGYTPKCAFT